MFTDCVGYLDNITEKRFEVSFKRWLAADHSCASDETAIYCCLHKGCLTERGFCWLHMAPQMWYFDYWFPSWVVRPHQKGTGGISQAFDLIYDGSQGIQSHLHHKCHKENQRKFVRSAVDDELNLQKDKPDSLTEAVSAFYAIFGSYLLLLEIQVHLTTGSSPLLLGVALRGSSIGGGPKPHPC